MRDRVIPWVGREVSKMRGRWFDVNDPAVADRGRMESAFPGIEEC